MLINFYENKRFKCTVNYDKAQVVTPYTFWFTKDDSYTQDMSNMLAEEISVYAALGEKLICVDISDEYKSGYKLTPFSDYLFCERESEKA